MSRDCCVAIPLSAIGLSAVCDCDTHYFWVSFMRTAMALATFAWSSLSLRHSLKFSCGDSNGDLMPFCASSEGSGESKWRFVCYSRQQRILWWVCTFAQAVTGQCNKYQDLLCWQQRLLGVCTFAQARLSLLYSIEISCAGWNGDFWNVHVSSEWCGEQPQKFCATISALYQCVKKCSQCVVIKIPQ